VVARVRKALRTRAVGHTGTLDPFATGLLVVLVGKATRLARFVEQRDKTYLATARLGIATETDDATGAVIESPPAGGAHEKVPDRQQVEAALTSFLGRQKQRPPAYSAKHVDGERSYQRARRGEAVTLPEVEITVAAITLERYQWPELEFRVTASPGTYIRALARDLGERLGVGAHLTALRREAIGSLKVDDAIPLAKVNAETPLLPPVAVLGHLEQVELTAEEARAVGFGQAITGHERQAETALLHDGRLIAIAEPRAGRLAPVVVLEPAP
jgi:tRNA pseudouridine55 synthase